MKTIKSPHRYCSFFLERGSGISQLEVIKIWNKVSHRDETKKLSYIPISTRCIQ